MNKDVEILLSEKKHNFDSLVRIMALLRSENGCPWDREQTHESIRNNFIEETYEVIEAIDTSDTKLLREELGDVLLQVVMHAQMEREEGRCTFSDVVNDICHKMIHRHPHVFGDVKAGSVGEVLAIWESIKSEEICSAALKSGIKLIKTEKEGTVRLCFAGISEQKIPAAAEKLSSLLKEL